MTFRERSFDYVLVALVLIAAGLAALVSTGCSPASRQNQTRVLNIATKAANEAEEGIVLAYRYQSERCLEKSATRLDFEVCRTELEHTYTKIRLLWGDLRRIQDQYATALEKGTYKPEDFLEWFRVSYCGLAADLPVDIVLPPVPGLSCQESAQ